MIRINNSNLNRFLVKKVHHHTHTYTCLSIRNYNYYYGLARRVLVFNQPHTDVTKSLYRRFIVVLLLLIYLFYNSRINCFYFSGISSMIFLRKFSQFSALYYKLYYAGIRRKYMGILSTIESESSKNRTGKLEFKKGIIVAELKLGTWHIC